MGCVVKIGRKDLTDIDVDPRSPQVCLKQTEVVFIWRASGGVEMGWQRPFQDTGDSLVSP
jgi:hypothetical protein